MFQKVRELSKNLAIYGAGDVAIQIVNFLLLRVYTEYLSKEEYGILALLGTIEAFVKLTSRWGVDGAFMRLWYDDERDEARQRLASTIFFFLLALNSTLLAASVIAAPTLSTWILGAPGYTLALQLVLLNTFSLAFTFIPFHVLRIQNRSREFSALTFARSLATLVLRIVLVVGFGMKVMGIVIADVVVTAAMIAVILRWTAPLIRRAFSPAVLREALRFGLPRVPHGLALQVMSVGDKQLLLWFGVALDRIGLYAIGVSVGLIPKLVLAAFEYAWAPFYYATSREPDAPRTFAAISTYVVALLALLTVGISAIAGDLLTEMTHGQYTAAEPIVVWTAAGVFCYGLYLLTSIGLNIMKRSAWYPISSLVGALTNVGLNLIWIPRYGILGAAWANGAAYATQAAVAAVLSQRVYPIRYEYGRLARVLAAAALAYLSARALPAMPPLAGIVARGTTVVAVMTGLLAVSGFLRPDELRALGALWRRRGTPPVTPPPETTERAGEILAAGVAGEDLAEPPGRR